MKHTIFSNFLLVAAVAVWMSVVIGMPPGNLSWRVFVDEPAPLVEKAVFLARTYLWPAVLSFCAIILFQLQFRLSTSGASKRTVFPICLLASLATLLGLQRLSLAPNSAPAYAAGMALAYMAMSRLYAIRMRIVWAGLSIPWIVWRGNPEAVRQIDRLAAQVRQARRGVRRR